MRVYETVSDGKISIHALRVEGDSGCDRRKGADMIFLSTPSGWRATSVRISSGHVAPDFYPRPPGGGRPMSPSTTGMVPGFLSTPSGWRATFDSIRHLLHPFDFYPRPPGGGRQAFPPTWSAASGISIHALRVEGDAMRKASNDLLFIFLSTPSGWRATARCLFVFRDGKISIHALRVEGDQLTKSMSYTQV